MFGHGSSCSQTDHRNLIYMYMYTHKRLTMPAPITFINGLTPRDVKTTIFIVVTWFFSITLPKPLSATEITGGIPVTPSLLWHYVWLWAIIKGLLLLLLPAVWTRDRGMFLWPFSVWPWEWTWIVNFWISWSDVRLALLLYLYLAVFDVGMSSAAVFTPNPPVDLRHLLRSRCWSPPSSLLPIPL